MRENEKELMMRVLVRILLISLILSSCQQTSVSPKEEILSSVSEVLIDEGHETGLKDAKSCATCHREIYNEWKQSMHANSSYFKDPIHKAVVDAYQKFRKSKGRPVDYHCASCHTPMADNRKELMQGVAKLDASNPSHQEGVSCRSCHSVVDVNKHPTFDRPVYSPEAIIYGAKHNTDNGVHVVRKWPVGSSNKVCLSCHGHKHNSKGVGICVMTGSKDAEFTQGSCVSCHMPKVSKVSKRSKRSSHSSHLFAGSRNRHLMAKAVTVDLYQTSNQIIVELKNNVSHAFPSSQPMRQAAVLVKALDRNGKVIWTNFPSPKDKTLLMVALASKEGKFPVPPWMAWARKFDTRLAANETRTLNFDKSLFSNANRVVVELKYRLLAPQMAKNFGIDPQYVIWQSIAKSTIDL